MSGVVHELGVALAVIAALVVSRQPFTSATVCRLSALAGEFVYFTRWAPEMGVWLFAVAVAGSLASWFRPNQGPVAEITEIVAWTWMALAIW